MNCCSSAPSVGSGARIGDGPKATLGRWAATWLICELVSPGLSDAPIDRLRLGVGFGALFRSLELLNPSDSLVNPFTSSQNAPGHDACRPTSSLPKVDLLIANPMLGTASGAPKICSSPPLRRSV